MEHDDGDAMRTEEGLIVNIIGRFIIIRMDRR